MMVSPESSSVAQLRDRVLRDVARRQHDPDGPWFIELCDQLLEIGAAGDALADERLDRRRRAVEDHAPMSVAREAAHHVGAHPS